MSGHCNKCNMNIIGICVPNVLQLVQQNPISSTNILLVRVSVLSTTITPRFATPRYVQYGQCRPRGRSKQLPYASLLTATHCMSLHLRTDRLTSSERIHRATVAADSEHYV